MEKGKSYSIPCRMCGKLIDFQVKQGSNQINCLRCNRLTEVDVRQVGETREIRTSLLPAVQRLPD
jgi:hypothetical protein